MVAADPPPAADPRSLVVLGVGGNALLPAGAAPSIEAQRARVATTCHGIAAAAARGVPLVVTHGNGPQVGAAWLRSEGAPTAAYPWPLDVCVAATQGEIGYLLQSALTGALAARGIDRPVCTVVTQVLVREDDPAFRHPTKPVGPVYAAAEAAALRARGWTLAERPPHGWQRVVASPEPHDVLEREAIRRLVRLGTVVVAAGGGGIPVVRNGDELRGVEAVVDKDLTSAQLAGHLGARMLVLATDVDRVYLDFGTGRERGLDTLTAAEARAHAAAGHFPPGTMGPKVDAAVRFVEGGGDVAVITALDGLVDALDGRAGTRVTRGR